MPTSSNAKNSPSPLAKMKGLVLQPKIEIVITILDDQKNESIPRYTTWDNISGQVSITAQNDTAFNDMFISFEGFTKTFVEKVASTSPTAGKIDVRIPPARYSFVQANWESYNIVSRLPCSPW